MENKRKSLYNIAGFLLGLLSCNNIIGIQVGNNTSINYAQFYAVGLFAVLIVFVRQWRARITSCFNKGFKFYISLAIISMVPSLVIFQGTSYSSSPIKSILVLITFLTIYCDVILLDDYRQSILNGLCIGVILNIVFSVLQLIFYRIGYDFSLSTWFPNSSFQYNIYWYRVQGLFLETSHFACFMIVVINLVFFKRKNVSLRWIVILSLLFLLGISFTGNFMLFLMAIVFDLVFITKKKMLKLGTIHLSIAFLSIALVSLIGLAFSDKIYDLLLKTNISEMIKVGLADWNINNTDNVSTVARYGNMIKALELSIKYPFGVGYGMASNMLILEYASDVRDAFSFIITVLLEMGLVGVVSYMLMIYQLGIRPFFKGKDIYKRKLGLSIIFMSVVQIANGVKWYPVFLIVMGLISAEEARSRKPRC